MSPSQRCDEILRLIDETIGEVAPPSRMSPPVDRVTFASTRRELRDRE